VLLEFAMLTLAFLGFLCEFLASFAVKQTAKPQSAQSRRKESQGHTAPVLDGGRGLTEFVPRLRVANPFMLMKRVLERVLLCGDQN
jgi:hypothetical protein